MANISVLESQLLDEYYRCERSLDVHKRALENDALKGYISVKNINGRKYYYLQWREASKVCSRYIKSEELEVLQQRIEKRNQLLLSVRNLNKNMRKLEKVLGRQLIEEYRSAL